MYEGLTLGMLSIGSINNQGCFLPHGTWELLAPWKGGRVTVPAKYIVGDQDLVYNSPGSKDYVHKGGFKKNVPSLEEVVVIEGAHHFIQQEKPKEISDHILKFFGNLSVM
eukprot:Gb_01802 [translate_table: standard]